MTNDWMATISLNRFHIETLSVQVGPTHGIGGNLQSLKGKKIKKRSLYTLYMLAIWYSYVSMVTLMADSFLPSKMSLSWFNTPVHLDGHKIRNWWLFGGGGDFLVLSSTQIYHKLGPIRCFAKWSSSYREHQCWMERIHWLNIYFYWYDKMTF